MVFILLKKINIELKLYQIKPTKKTIDTLINENNILEYIKKHLNRGKTINYKCDKEYLHDNDKYIIYTTNTTKDYSDYIVLKYDDRDNMKYTNLIDCKEEDLEYITNYLMQMNNILDNTLDNIKVSKEKELNEDELENETGIDLEEEEEEEDLYLDNNSQYENDSEYDKENNTEFDEDIELEEEQVENIDFDLENTSQLEEDEYNYPEKNKNLNRNEL